MKLPDVELSRDAQLAEFDAWVTPALEDLTETARFREELRETERILEFISNAFGQQHDVGHLAEAAQSELSALPSMDRHPFVESLFSVLFLVTARSDNAVKCQFPLFLRDAGHSYPRVRRRGGQAFVEERDIPRVLKATDVAATLMSLAAFPEHQFRLLRDYLEFVLSGETASRQLSVIADIYADRKARGDGSDADFLAPLVAFKVRGSVSASGGHTPEHRVRSQMAEWGLLPGHDFNLSDVVVDAVLASTWITYDGADGQADLPEEVVRGSKSRAFDLVVPYLTQGAFARLFIQSQFYAGDSGSVSHKNVDQARQSRRETSELISEGIHFIELVDGAGYCASLRRDLQYLIFDELTETFFQLRSAPIRLRRALQMAGFVTPLEIEQLVRLGATTRTALAEQLTSDGYAEAEIQRALQDALERELLNESGDSFAIHSDRREVVDAYILLDCIARQGEPLEDPKVPVLMIPGYGPAFGVPRDAIEAVVAAAAPSIDSVVLPSQEEVEAAIAWSSRRGYLSVSG